MLTKSMNSFIPLKIALVIIDRPFRVGKLQEDNLGSKREPFNQISAKIFSINTRSQFTMSCKKKLKVLNLLKICTLKLWNR